MGQTLADLGADVIKVEAPEGDETRRWGPPFVHGADGAQADAAYFHCCNRGKRSVIADFRSARDLDLVRRLIDRSDIVIENFKTGALQKFGLDYATVRPRNPRLIYCSVTGFGQDGPYSARAGYDAMIQAMSGIMDITGDPDGEPQKIGVALADILTGVYGVVAIQAALTARERTGEGQQIDMALFDVMVGVLANQALNYFVSGTAPHRIGNAHPNIVPYQTFPTSDGHVMVAVGSDPQFAKLCTVLGRSDLATDERYATNALRVRNRGALIAVLREEIHSWKRDELLARLADLGVPAGPINTIADVFSDPRSRHAQCASTSTAPTSRAASFPASGLRCDSPPRSFASPGPLRGSASTRTTSRASWESGLETSGRTGVATCFYGYARHGVHIRLPS